jgi:N-acyl amino acid synthase of PEP-CTERM/exosortase system
MYEDASQRNAFHRYFEVIPALTQELRNVVFNIRFQVYCEELGYEDVARFPDRRERDEYDDSSMHCLLRHRASGAYAGCVRLVLGDSSVPRRPLPVERACGEAIDKTIIDLDKLRPGSYGEISRLAVISAFRKRSGERNTPSGIISEASHDPNERRRFPHIALGLHLSATAMVINHGLACGLALMEPRLARHLGMFGIHFAQIGSEVQHHGIRAPYQITPSAVYKVLPDDLRHLLEDIRQTILAA